MGDGVICPVDKAVEKLVGKAVSRCVQRVDEVWMSNLTPLSSARSGWCYRQFSLWTKKVLCRLK
jgi:hypothetical protein